MDRDNRPDMYLILSDTSSDPPAPIKQFARSRGVVEIGRASRTDSAAHDPTSGKMRSSATKVMSSQHAKITWDGDRAFIQDVGSCNGTTRTRRGISTRLTTSTAFEMKDDDLLTFGRQVDHSNTVICKPVVLVAKFSSKPLLSLGSSTQSAPLSHSSATSAALDRSNTLTGPGADIANLSVGSDVEMDGFASTFVHGNSDKRTTSCRRIKFGLTDEDLLVSAEEEDDDADVTFVRPRSFSPPSRCPASKAASSTSIAAVSNLSVRGSPVPRVGKHDDEASVVNSYSSRRSDSPVEVVSSAADRGLAEKNSKHSSYRLPSPLSPENADKRPLQGGDSDGDGEMADLSERIEWAALQRRHASYSDDDGELESHAAPAALSAPTSLFFRPTASPAPSSLASKNRTTRFDSVTTSISELDMVSQPGSHLPSPVASPRSEEVDDFVDEDRLWELKVEARAAAQAAADAEQEIAERKASQGQSSLRYHPLEFSTWSGGFARDEDDEEFDDIPHIARSNTPPGRPFSPPTSSPLTKTLADFLVEQEEDERLVRDAESHAPESDDPPMSLFEDDEAEEAEEVEAVEEVQEVVPTAVKEEQQEKVTSSIRRTSSQGPMEVRISIGEALSVDPADIVSRFARKDGHPSTLAEYGEQLKQAAASFATFPMQRNEEEKLEPAESAPGDSCDEDEDEDEDEAAYVASSDISDFETDEVSMSADPDLDSVDLDADASVGEEVDSGSNVEEVDEQDGLGAEEQRWEDGVSENLVEKSVADDDEEEEEREEEEQKEMAVEEEQAAGEKAAVDEVADDGHAAERKGMQAFLDKGRLDEATRTLLPTRSSSFKEKTPSFIDASTSTSSGSSVCSPRKRRLSETTFEEEEPQEERAASPVVTVSLDQLEILGHSVDDFSHSVEKFSTQLATVADLLEHNDTHQGPIEATPVVVQPVEAAAVAEPAPKRRRLGFSVRSFALGLATGMVAAVGGLSALGAMLEDE
ncbi:hypothetical protein JCM8547_006185 [Rhodosporidiobolus lusitaniae]